MRLFESKAINHHCGLCPKRFYAPAGLFSESDLRSLDAKCLGEWIISPDGSFAYRVVSGPLCRLHWEEGKATPSCFESGWIQDEQGRWRKRSSNYLSYAIAGGGFLTVRWEPVGTEVLVQAA